jgi:outer membrane protein assembly factor BamB
LSFNGVISATLSILILGQITSAAAQLNRFDDRGTRYSADRFQLSAAEIKSLPNEAATNFVRATAFLKEENWEEAIEIIQQLSEQFGDHLRAVDQDRYLSVRRTCQMLIAEMPPEALKLYRGRVDAAAEDWYEKGIAGQETQFLQRVVDHFFCSALGDDALLALGDRALEKGRYDRARGYWERIDPSLRSADGLSLWHALYGVDVETATKAVSSPADLQRPWTWLVYPDTDTDLAAVRARLVLASILQGDIPRAKWELALFRGLHPREEGRLAGSTGVYVERLDELLREQALWPSRLAEGDWPTFAGSPSRNRVLPAAFDVPPVCRWKIRYADVMRETELPAEKEQTAGVAAQEAGLYFYPLVVGTWALLNNSEQIFAFAADTGEPAFEGSRGGQIYPEGDLSLTGNDRAAHSALNRPQHSMTVYQGRLFARIGTQVTSRPPGFTSGYAGNRLICVDLSREGALQWKYPSNRDEVLFDRERWAFEGPPLSDGDGVYVVMRQGSARAACYVACLDYQTGALRWRRKVCDADTPVAGREIETTHNLLTLSEGILYLNTNLGAIVSLRVTDGNVRWVYQYPRVASGNLRQPPVHFHRGLNPCVYYRGMIMAAPRDSRFLFALDASTGRLVWRTAPMTAHPMHLLGVSSGMLLATGKSIWWFNAVTGRAEYAWPEPGNQNTPRGYGRGVLAGGMVYWPTREKIYVFDQRVIEEDGRRVAKQRATIDLLRPDVPAEQRVRGGNLVVGDNILLIAGHAQLQALPLRDP